LFETVDAALLKLIVNALQDVHASAWWVLGKDMH
jgi:hypothetical protein